MTRARQTAKIINRYFPHLQLLQSKLLRECTPPTWRKDISAEVPEALLLKCKIQLDEAFSIYFTPSPLIHQHDIIVCHGNVIRFFVAKILKVNPKSWLGMIISNCSLTVVRIFPDGKKRLVSFNDIGHIPPNMQTDTGAIYPTDDLKIPE
jgi:broad specificity phosphatase PhoE